MPSLTLPASHPHRTALSEEVHARPPQPLTGPLSASYLVLYTGPEDRDADRAAIADLAKRFSAAAPSPDATHYSAHLGPVRVIWERHTEFTRYTFIRQNGDERAPFDNPPIAEAPSDWLESLPGEIIYAAHVLMVNAAGDGPAIDETARALFGDAELVGARIGAGHSVVLTSFRSHGDGFNRFLIRNASLNPIQAGRLMRNLLEMDTYRMMALLGLPPARQMGRTLTERERELAEITHEMADGVHSDESGLLDRITRLQADIERRHSQHRFRFTASEAYYGIVQARIDELREQRLERLQTFAEFVERRLAPAMNTVKAVSERLGSMSERLSRVTQLLSTRVALTQEQQSRKLLAAMARRAKLQLRLQRTVEGLSIAAISYYVVGLFAYLAKGGEDLGLPYNATLVTAAAIPIVVFMLAYGLRRVRAGLNRTGD
ncbi:DUF3422 domain-containing protein [Alkalicaulis satelles]|uniref:DUF3422 domain-containing protein n=1 Tax=Alkalicaulis satelles TaxID=2609175 RepID=A0A5M6ZLF0_9PROT|nr:DUF3422 domain-containing protein [Alkalicaulis satelles]KAA5804048.1 DUF3422 domain-containing protein [Alkalicaulis satelles]